MIQIFRRKNINILEMLRDPSTCAARKKEALLAKISTHQKKKKSEIAFLPCTLYCKETLNVGWCYLLVVLFYCEICSEYFE